MNKSETGFIKIYTEAESFLRPADDDFYMNEYKDDEAETLNRVEPHRHTYHEIIWVKSGTGIHSIDFIDYRFAGPCLFLLHPQHVHCIKKDGPTEGGVIKFTPSFFFENGSAFNNRLIGGIFDDIEVNPVILLTPLQSDQFSKIFNDLYREFQDISVVTPQLLTSYLQIFLLKIYSIKKSTMQGNLLNTPFMVRFHAFQSLLENNFKQHHEPSYYAKQLHITRKTLYNTTRKATGRAPSDLITKRILLEAKRLLNYSGLSVKEIGYQLGYEDSSYFIRFFFHNTNANPLQYKNSCRGL